MRNSFVRARSSVAFLALAAIAFGCSTRDSGGPTGTSPPPPPPPAWTSLVSRQWTAFAGALDEFECTQTRVPSDLYITGFRTVASQGEVRLFLTVTDQLIANGDFECNAGDLGERLIYASGINTPDFTLPAGVGVHVKAGQYLLMNVQVYNRSATASNGSTEVLIKSGTAAELTHSADMLLVGTQNIHVAAHSTADAFGGCTFPDSAELVALFPLMHFFGVNSKLRVNTTPIENSPYSSAQQLYTTLPAPFTVHPGDDITNTCSYSDTTNVAIQFGDGVTSEVCYNAIYRYPAPDSVTGVSFYSCVIT